MRPILVFGVIALGAVGGGAWNVPAQAAVSFLASIALGYGIFKKSFYKADLRAALAAFFIFTAYIAARVFLSPGAGGGLWVGFIEAVNWASYMAIYTASSGFTDDERDFFFALLLRLGAFLVALFFAQRIFGAGASDFTAWATLPKKNVFALVMLASAYAVYDPRKIRLTTTEWVCSLAAVIAAMFAFSVSIALGFAASAAVIFNRAYPLRKKLWVPLLSAPVIFILSAKFLWDPRVMDRARWYGAAIRMMLSRPLFGTGAASFAASAPSFSVSKFHSVYAHSLYLETLAETGIVGFVLLAALFYFIAKQISDIRARAIFALVATVAATDFVFNIPISPLIFFAASGAGSAVKADGLRKISPRATAFARSVAMILAAAIMAASLVKYDVWSRLRRVEVSVLDGNRAEPAGIGYGRLGESALATLKMTDKR